MLAYFAGSAMPSDIPLPLIVAAAALVIGALRYAMIAGGALGLVTLFAERLSARRIQKIPFTTAQLKRELGYSLMTIAVFASLAALITWGRGGIGPVRLAMPDSALGWVVAAALVPVALLLHDFYFYWMHRLIHVSWIYTHVHRVHHLSTNPSPLAALAFHPIEALLEALGVTVVVALLPVPLPTLIVFGVFAFGLNVLGHLGYELIPARVLRSPVGRWLNSSTSHNLHHRAFRANFGLYTLIWDRVFGTIDPRYDASLQARLERHSV